MKVAEAAVGCSESPEGGRWGRHAGGWASRNWRPLRRHMGKKRLPPIPARGILKDGPWLKRPAPAEAGIAEPDHRAAKTIMGRW